MLKSFGKAIKISPFMSFAALCYLQLANVSRQEENDSNNKLTTLCLLAAVANLSGVKRNFNEYLKVKEHLHQQGYNPLETQPYFNHYSERQQLKIAARDLNLQHAYYSQRSGLGFFKQCYIYPSPRVTCCNLFWFSTVPILFLATLLATGISLIESKNKLTQTNTRSPAL